MSGWIGSSDSAYLVELASSILPKSALAKAVTYARNQWAALRRYTADGRLTIDNNTSERTLRHQAIGRKNWLFLGSKAAAQQDRRRRRRALAKTCGR